MYSLHVVHERIIDMGHCVCLPKHLKFRTARRILMKSDMNVMPLEEGVCY
jgi:hypothetical protein